MRILVFSHNYAPEGNAPAARFSAMCSDWSVMGHEVQVITCTPNFPLGVVFDGCRNKFLQREFIGGTEVIRVWTLLTPNRGFLRRTLGFLVYMVLAFAVSLFQKRPDVIIGTSPQFFAAWAGLLSSRCRWRRIPFIADIRDLWPDSIVAVGAAGNSLPLRFVFLLERLLYRYATKIVLVSPAHVARLEEKNVPKEKITVIPNGVDGMFLDATGPDGEFRKQYDLAGKFLCAYVGTIGMASRLHLCVEAARRLKEAGRNDVKLLLVGDGAARNDLQAEAERNGLDNIVFTGLVSRDRIPGILASVDVCLVHLKAHREFLDVMPSKMYEAAAIGKPILLGVEGEARRWLNEAEAGIFFEPENVDSFLNELRRLHDDPALRKNCGENGRRFVREHYNRNVFARQYAELMFSLTGKS